MVVATQSERRAWAPAEVQPAVEGVVGHATDVRPLRGSLELVGDLGFDSLAVIEIMAELEDEFEITITERDLRQVFTLGDVVAAVRGRLAEQGRLVP
ncbi:MAG: acyl carrier protein [Myxococcota bacterium]